MNKKIVIIVVLVECIFAVLLISFFGQAIYNTNNTVECAEIHFVYENGDKIEDNKVIEVELNDNNLSYQLHVAIYPQNATNKKLGFTSSRDEVTVDSKGLVTFYSEVGVTITVKTLDGSNKMDTIILVPKRNTSSDVT